ncbi:crotonase/enoyl-CoA hydratase family protein [Sphingobium sp.]|uniref:crotonase/enoyl-CoA hydratase family protein n=1 Tax=Sphingobium sp. TaxID=1912891 RepID=UPI0028BD1701|nr:crotonase/enoyl-CoA hydratase family protein [Sphingobium sp.]
MTDFVQVEVDDGIAIFTLNAPQSRNALSDDGQYASIEAACRAAELDPRIRCVILTGAGKAFCAGGDIKAMLCRIDDPALEAVDDRYHYKHGIHRIPRALFDLEVPLIAAVNGPAIGAGLDLACLCDIRIAGESARFAESFVKLGIIPGDGGAFLLQRIVGISKAAELTFTGRTIGPAEAQACGLVSEVTLDVGLMDRAKALARDIAQNPPQALRMAKRLLREAQTTRLESILELSASFQALAHATKDHENRLREAVSRLGGGQ